MFKVTDRVSGEFGIYSLETLIEDLTVYGMTETEKREIEELVSAIVSNDYEAIEKLSISLGIDIEFI